MDSIYCHKDYGPWFGTCFFGIGNCRDNFCSESNSNYLNDIGTYGGKDYKKYEINNFEKAFVCKELEVLEVKYLEQLSLFKMAYNIINKFLR